MKIVKKEVFPINTRFAADEREYLKRLAEAQGHGKISKVLRRMVRREMHG